MHSISALLIIAAIIILVLYIVSSAMASFDEEYYNTVDTGYDARYRDEPPAPPPPTRITMTQLPEASDRVRNHYSNQRKNHPINQHDPRVYGTTARTGSAVDWRASGSAINIDYDHARLYRTYDELSDDEKRQTMDLNKCAIYVHHDTLHPLLQSIAKSSNGNSQWPEYVIAYYNTEKDGELTSYDKRIRKSLAIKDVRLNRNRYVRFRFSEHDKTWCILRFHDYTPYIEVNAPRFDPYTQEFSTDTSRWETVASEFYYDDQRINGKWLNVLVPAT